MKTAAVFAFVTFFSLTWSQGYSEASGDECVQNAKGAGYRGTLSTTAGGYTCQKWSSQSPHRHYMLSNHPNQGLVENFCRNPDNDKRPWCYTTNPSKRLDFCKLPLCKDYFGPGGAGSKEVNIALHKSATQSSTLSYAFANRAVDGNRNPQWGGSSCTLTNIQLHAWWRVDLGKEMKVAMVRITNRGTNYGNRLSNFDIRISNFDGTPTGSKICLQHFGAIGQGSTVELACVKPVFGRFVYVMLQGKNYLTLCEVEVFSRVLNKGLRKNLARFSDAIQSSTYSGGDAARSVDGSRKNLWSESSCSMTNNEDHAWWRVDLGAKKPVKMVRITNRGDNAHGLSFFSVLVGDHDRYPSGNKLCIQYYGKAPSGGTFELTCEKAMIGRYVFVMQNTKNYLSMCEFEVYSQIPNDSNGNIALFRNARQSSTYSIYSAARAVNGDRTTYYTKGSCSITNSELNAWWMVDLGAAKTVAVLRITARILKDSLKHFDIRVGDNCYDPTGAQLCLQQFGSISQGATVDLSCKSPLKGRYVYIVLRSKGQLGLCEVGIYSAKPKEDLNLAKYKRTSQSGLYSYGYSAQAVDGNRDGVFAHRSCSMTANKKNAWWRVDLNTPRTVAMVKITNGATASWVKFMSNFDIRVGNYDGNPLVNPICISFFGHVGSSHTATLNCNKPMVGRFVYVMLRGTSYLQICEFQVYSKAAVIKPSDNLALYKSTKMDGIYSSSVSSNAVDGVLFGGRNAAGCAMTAHKLHAWWEVDLGAAYTVNYVRISSASTKGWNAYNANFDIRVGNVDGSPLPNPLCYHYGGRMPLKTTVTLRCHTAMKGRFVYAMASNKNYLMLCEVEVYTKLPTQFAQGDAKALLSNETKRRKKEPIHDKNDPIDDLESDEEESDEMENNEMEDYAT